MLSNCAFVTSLSLDLKHALLLEMGFAEARSAGLTYQHGAMASRGMRGQKDKLWLSKCSLKQRYWLVLLDNIWQPFYSQEKLPVLAKSQLRSCIFSRYIVQMYWPKKFLTFFCLISAAFVTVGYFFCGWILGAASSLAGFLGSLRLDYEETMPCCSCYPAWSIWLCTNTELWQSTDFRVTLLEFSFEDHKWRVHWTTQVLSPRIQTEIYFHSHVLTFKFIFQITKVCCCISGLNNCGIHVYENQVIMHARFH